jgi:hypothetical protein
VNRGLVLSAAIAMVALPALATPPAEIADLVGARAPGAEAEMQTRGYQDIHDNTWWNSSTKTCVRVHVSEGHYSRIDTLAPGDCGQGSQGSAGANASGEVPEAVLNACSRRADEYQNAARGTSSVEGATQNGGEWVLKMATGTYKSKCTADSNGSVKDISPM